MAHAKLASIHMEDLMKKALMALVFFGALSNALVAQTDNYNEMKESLPSNAHIRVLMGSEEVLLTKVEAAALRAKMTILLGKLEGAEVINQHLSDQNFENVNKIISDFVQAYPTHVGGNGITAHEVGSKGFAVISATPTVLAMLAADKVVSWLPLIGVTRYSLKLTPEKPIVWNNPRSWFNVFGRKDKAYFEGRWVKKIGTATGYTIRAGLFTVGALVVIDEINNTEALIVMQEEERAKLEKEVKRIISNLDKVVF
jgi:hypothetical protein